MTDTTGLMRDAIRARLMDAHGSDTVSAYDVQMDALAITEAVMPVVLAFCAEQTDRNAADLRADADGIGGDPYWDGSEHERGWRDGIEYAVEWMRFRIPPVASEIRARAHIRAALSPVPQEIANPEPSP